MRRPSEAPFAHAIFDEKRLASLAGPAGCPLNWHIIPHHLGHSDVTSQPHNVPVE
jgi:hypothetical protein